jgi:hypothetical protein
VIDDELLVKTRTNTCLSYTSAVPSYSVAGLTKIEKLKDIKTRIRKLEKTGKKHTKRRIVSVKMYMLFS